MDGAVKFDSITMSLEKSIDDIKDISHAIVLLGDTQPDSCFEDPEKSERLNVASINSLLAELKTYNIKPVFTSTEHVFDGRKGNYSEDDDVSPTLLYGRQKVAIESMIQENFSEYLILRLAKVYGCYDEMRSSLFTEFLENIARNKSIKCATDQYFSPVHVRDVFGITIAAIDKDLSGLYHLSGNERWSRCDLLELTLDTLRKYVPVELQVKTCSIDDFNLPEPRPKDVSLNSEKVLRTLNYPIKSVSERCQEIVKAFIGRNSKQYMHS
jgi:dTDP-4-dehydrorhamnose reductase